MSLRILSRSLLRTASALRPAPRFLAPRIRVPSYTPRRLNSSSTTAPATTPAPETDEREPPPSYQLHFTCRPCQERSSHTVSKQAYHHGSVLVQCPGCSNRHVITDHLKIFGETAKTLEQILEEKGEVLKKGRLLPGGTVELLPPDETEGGDASEGAK
ncbi:DNL zinc finger domain protein [Geopyxis carbonaria]|nr:DNL zinc finger domain protein [Geopyxis carbonaria]